MRVKIHVYKVIDDETRPEGIVFKSIDETMTHIRSWVESISQDDEFEIKVISDEMTESEFEDLPEFD